MANFFTDTKNKMQDLFVYLVSCGKSSKGNDQELARDAPLGDDLGLQIYIPEEDQTASDVPPRTAQGQGHITVLQPGKVTQNQGQPALNIISPVEENIEQQEGQGNSQEQKAEKQENDDDDIEPLPEGFIPEERANFSRPPGKRSAPIPKTG